MAELKVIVFDVERGLCVFIRTPNGYGVMVDCGWCSAFSPTAWLLEHEVSSLEMWNGYRLYKLIVTHPHDDHVEDIAMVSKYLTPAVLLRQKSYDWDAVLNPDDGDPSENARQYYEWQKNYNGVITASPDLGCEIRSFALTPAEAAAIDPNPQHLLNNSSYVTVLTYQSLGMAAPWKVVIAGDNETKGWEALLRKEAFRQAIGGADFFITAHHGHESGFCAELFEAMGLPFLNVSSERAGDPSVFDYGPYARGVTIDGTTRRHVVTRKDSHITLRLGDDLKYRIMLG